MKRLAVACALVAALSACGKKQEQERQKQEPIVEAPQSVSGGEAPPQQPHDVEPGPEAIKAGGAMIAQQGINGAPPCSTCHGANGEGNAQTGFPRLAGQGRSYLAHQLDAYADGSRKNPVMEPIAKKLEPQQRTLMAAYYEMPNGAAASAPSSAHAPKRREPITSIGDESKQIQACANCHGPGGLGEPPAYPSLAGQNAQYLTSAMRAWKDGSRNSDPSGQMVAIAKSLSEEDANGVVQYFAAQSPPPPLAAQPPNASGETPPAGPTAPAAQSQGVGTEQGAPVGGGGQGPGNAEDADKPKGQPTAPK